MTADGELDGVVERPNGEAELEPGEPTEPHRRHAKALEGHSRDASDPSVLQSSPQPCSTPAISCASLRPAS